MPDEWVMGGIWTPSGYTNVFVKKNLEVCPSNLCSIMSLQNDVRIQVQEVAINEGSTLLLPYGGPANSGGVSTPNENSGNWNCSNTYHLFRFHKHQANTTCLLMFPSCTIYGQVFQMSDYIEIQLCLGESDIFHIAISSASKWQVLGAPLGQFMSKNREIQYLPATYEYMKSWYGSAKSTHSHWFPIPSNQMQRVLEGKHASIHISTRLNAL